MASNSKSSGSRNIRKLAENLIAQGQMTEVSGLSLETIEEIVQELHIHQVELELQNEELREVQMELQASRDAYVSLYDFAPVGYVTIDSKNRVVQANLTACRMFGLDRVALLKKTFSALVAKADADALYFCLKDTQKGLATGQLRFHRPDGGVFSGELRAERAAPPSSPELIRIAIIDITQQVEAENDLASYRDHLEEQVVERTRELRDLSHRLVEIQEKERASIGAELHDEIGQLLTYALLMVNSSAQRTGDKMLADAKKAIQDAMSKTRDLSSMLSPGILRSAGLMMAVECYAGEYQRRYGVEVDFRNEGKVDTVPQAVALAAYRIVQESLTNIARHAKAANVVVQLIRGPGRLYVEIADNGIGFDPALLTHSTGLIGMRERVFALGGEFSISGNDGSGTKVSAVFPLGEK